MYLFFVPPVFYWNGKPTWLCCETSLSCTCLFRQTGQVAAYLASMVSATSALRRNWSRASDPAEPLCAGAIPPAHQCCTSSILQCTCYTLLSGELCFCSFLLSVVQRFTVVLEVIPLHFNAMTVLPHFIYLFRCLVWSFISNCFSFC